MPHNPVLRYYMRIHLYKTLYLEKTNFHMFRIPPCPNLDTELKHQANQFKTKHLVTLSHASAWGQVVKFEPLTS